MKALTIANTWTSWTRGFCEIFTEMGGNNTSPVLCICRLWAAINYFYNQNNHYVHLYNVCGNVK